MKKVYVHSEKSDITEIVTCTPSQTYRDVLKNFVSLASKRGVKGLQIPSLSLTTSSGNLVDMSSTVKDDKDLFVIDRKYESKNIDMQVENDMESLQHDLEAGFMKNGDMPALEYEPRARTTRYNTKSSSGAKSSYSPATPIKTTTQATPSVITPKSSKPQASRESNEMVIDEAVSETKSTSGANKGIVHEEPLKAVVESQCPVCSEYIEHARDASIVTCKSCQLKCKPVKLVDIQASCAKCDRTVFRERGRKIIECPDCKHLCAPITCNKCKTPFVFPIGISEFPCVSCETLLTPELVTCHKEVEYGLLVNASVNEPESFKEQFTKSKSNKINLITQYYIDSSAERQKELDHCLAQNIACNQIDRVHLLLESENDIPTKIIGDSEKVKVTILGHRWKYIDAFQYCNDNLDGQICVISNSDIYFDQTLHCLHFTSMRGKLLAITRIDVTKEDKLIFNEWTAAICQDTWVTQSPIPEKIVEKSDFYFGWRGCDNHVAWLFRENLFHILNPCLKITTRHCHATEKRNIKDHEKVEGEYVVVPVSGDI
jgi:hypothetical protein